MNVSSRLTLAFAFLTALPVQAQVAQYAWTNFVGNPGIAGNANGTGSAAGFDGPTGMTADASGNFYVADTFNDTIQMITSAGEVTTLAGSAGKTGSTDGTGSAARFNHPHGVTVDGSGNVYGLTTTYGSTATVTLTPNNGTAAQSVSAALTGLPPGTTYHYQLAATNGNGTAGTIFTTDPNNVVTLANLVLSGGASLAPYFSIDTVHYTASVPNATTSIWKFSANS